MRRLALWHDPSVLAVFFWICTEHAEDAEGKAGFRR